MSFALSMSTRLHLRDIVDNHMSGSVCLDEFVDQAKNEVRQLKSSLLSLGDFLLVLDAAKNYHPAEGRPIYTSILANEYSHRITLLGIPMYLTIPLHDHPNMVSIVAFLSGRIHSPVYRVTSKDCGFNLAELMKCSVKTYTQGDISVLTPDTGNLHSMEGLTAKAVCLSIQLSISSSFRKQSYYFPAVPESAESERSLWYRIPFRRHSDDV